MKYYSNYFWDYSIFITIDNVLFRRKWPLFGQSVPLFVKKPLKGQNVLFEKDSFMQVKKKLLDRVRDKIRFKHYSLSIACQQKEHTYTGSNIISFITINNTP